MEDVVWELKSLTLMLPVPCPRHHSLACFGFQVPISLTLCSQYSLFHFHVLEGLVGIGRGIDSYLAVVCAVKHLIHALELVAKRPMCNASGDRILALLVVLK